MFKHKCFPLTYLGCPLYIGKKKKEYFDDWMGSGALSNILSPPSHYNKDKVKDFIHEGEWDFDKLSDILPPQVVNQIVSSPIGDSNHSDYVIWIPSEDGHFTTKSAYVDCSNTRE
ncbi:hypothetical protein H5410_037489 [Solanum commersonii]|uniref:Uncharacterized protein n=1 Tax=Solanum commersonii TaxID=4109 RepID=A0A9J5Y7A8_SOLCO|nr:hypothetical protein H5410_037489 [Solanum commersonii]